MPLAWEKLSFFQARYKNSTVLFNSCQNFPTKSLPRKTSQQFRSLCRVVLSGTQLCIWEAVSLSVHVFQICQTSKLLLWSTQWSTASFVSWIAFPYSLHRVLKLPVGHRGAAICTPRFVCQPFLFFWSFVWKFSLYIVHRNGWVSEIDLVGNFLPFFFLLLPWKDSSNIFHICG